MRKFAPLFALLFVLGLAACDSSGGGETTGGDTVGTSDTTGGSDSTVDPCSGITQCALTDAPVCVDGASFQTCITDANGCTVWSTPQACPTGQSCSNGQCATGCVADCAGKVCGDDGCGGTCGDCPTGQACDAAGQCIACVADCTGKTCGDDGCGGSCGECAAGQTCTDAGVCETDCVPDCAGKQCGGDGCGGTCGNCGAGFACDDQGQCQNVCQPDCAGKVCGNDGCGGSCGFCDAGEDCVNGQCQGCQPDCTGRVCGPDGCGGSCGDCGAEETCQAGQCIGCVPDCADKACGGDGCGGSCGTCPAGQTCDAGACVACTPDCDGKACGDDGCGGSCGTCGDGLTCLGNTCVCIPDCEGLACGDNGCGGSCGECQTGEACVEGVCEACTPDCGDAVCGDDGCGGSCGTCAEGESCVEGACEGGCVPDCTGRACGDDGCNGSCGACQTGERCTDAGQCVSETAGYCADYFTCAGTCGEADQACIDACYQALTAEGQTRYGNLVNCLNTRCSFCYEDGADVGTCLNNCAVAECTPEYGTCFYRGGQSDCTQVYTCLNGCEDQACVSACYDAMSPQGFVDVVAWQTCQADNCPSCTVPDPSAADLEQCNTCSLQVSEGVCNDEALACFGECVPQCDGRECGDDGCGGTCGSCGAGEICNASGTCETAGTGGNCVSYFDCAANCGQTDQACLDSCRGTLAADSLALLDAYQGCVADNCAGATSQEEFEQCIFSFCVDSYAGCVYEDGTDDCGTFYNCITGCQDQACVDACFDTVSADGWTGAIDYENCIFGECAICNTGTEAECQACLDTAASGACQTATQACFGADCVDLCADRDCGFDGCGGYCGTCATGECSPEGLCEVCEPSCGDAVCGDDGCGGSCGTCGEGEACSGGQCVEAVCDTTGFTITEQVAGVSAAQSILQYQAVDGPDDTANLLQFELYQDATFGGPTEPGTYELTGAELNYATCGLCIRMFATDTQYFPTGGTVQIDSIGAAGTTFSGTLTGVTMVEVTINETTFESTPVDGGMSWCLDSLAFEATLQDLDAAK